MSVEAFIHTQVDQENLTRRLAGQMLMADTRPYTRADGADNLVQDHTSHLHLIDSLQTVTNQALHVSPDEENLIRSYNFVLDRANYERLTTPLERQLFKNDVIRSMDTNLIERYHVGESHTKYLIDRNGKLRSEFFPKEPFEDVLFRGVEYRKAHNSPELDREEQELRGIQRIQEKFADPNTPLGAQMMLISPPGIVAETTYTKNFVDILELCEDPETKERFIQAVRFTSPVSYEDYRRIVEGIDPQFFTKKKTEDSLDGWYLANPIYFEHTTTKTPRELFDRYFPWDETAMVYETYEHIIKTCMPFIMHYIDVLCRDEFDPVQVAIAFNAVLNKGDQTKRLLEKGLILPQEKVLYQDISLEADRLGRQKVETTEAGCGSSAGFSIGKMYTMTFSNSVAKFGIAQERKPWEYHPGTCVVCETDALVGPCKICKSCESKFDNEA